jgi:cysteine desulfurase
VNRIYFDNNATTELDPLVLEAMLEELRGPPSNPSSVHYFGKRAKSFLVAARARVASFFGVKAEELIFTSGGTEGLNTLVRGLFGSQPKGHLVTSAIEHASLDHTVRVLEGMGLSVTRVPVDGWGAPRQQEIEAALRSDTRALLFSAVNTETGVKLDLPGVAHIAERHGIPLLLDLVALVGKEPFELPRGVAAAVFSAHKFHGPKGVGGMVVRSCAKFTPLLTGGGQEFNRRSGTENVAGIVGLARAIAIVQERQAQITDHLFQLRQHFEEKLRRVMPGIQVNGAGPRVVNTSNLAFQDMDGETLLMHLDMAGIAASHGSACSSGALEPSRILLQMGLPLKRVRSSLRFSFGRMNTITEVDTAINRMAELMHKLYPHLCSCCST